MPATPASSILSDNVLLQAIDGGERWLGQIVFNLVEAGNAAEIQRFAAALPSPYVTDNVGLAAPMANAVTQSLRIASQYADIRYAFTEALDANYLVSDFRRPDSPNNAGIGAFPGSTPILALNVRTWDDYTPNQQAWIAVHEVGHTLGLAHPDGLPEQLDRSQYTMMSYDWGTLGDPAAGTGLPLTPMALDVAFLQANYGIAENHLGQTAYYLAGSQEFYAHFQGQAASGWVNNGVGYICIWDTAGSDSLIASADYSGGVWAGALLNLNTATLTTTAYTGDLAEVIGEVARTSAMFQRLSALTQAEIVDPTYSAGGFFSSRLNADGERYPAGYTIARGVTIESGVGSHGADLIVGNGAGNRLSGAAGDDELFGGAGHDRLEGGAGADRLFGGTGSDTITDDFGANFLRGGDGDDSLSGGSAAFDDIHGNQGADTIRGGPGGDWLVGGQGNDVITGLGGDAILYGNLGDDTLEGGAGAEILRGGQGADRVIGGAGDDWVSGDRGDDILAGGAGADIFHMFAEAGTDRVLDFYVSQGDRVQLLPGARFTLAEADGSTVISLDGSGKMILMGIPMTHLPPGWIFGA